MVLPRLPRIEEEEEKEEEELLQPEILPEIEALEETTLLTTKEIETVISPDVFTVPPVVLEDTFFSAEEAAQFGADLPIDWQIKVTPEGVVSILDPGGWEFLEGDFFISPEGVTLTLAQVEALLELPEEERILAFPTLPQVFEPIDAIPEVPVTDRIAELEAQLAGLPSKEQLFAQMPALPLDATTAQIAAAATIEEQITTVRELEQQIASLKIQETLGIVFPGQEIAEIAAFYFPKVEDISLVPPAERARVEEEQALAKVRGQEFIDKIIAAGRTPETVALLKTLDPSLSDRDIIEIFFPFEDAEELKELPIDQMPTDWKAGIFTWVERQIGRPLTLGEVSGKIPIPELGWRKWSQALADAIATGGDLPTLGLKQDIKDAINVFRESITKLPKQIAASALQATQGKEGASVVNPDWADEFIKEAGEDFDKFLDDIAEQYPDGGFIMELAAVSRNLAFSIVSLGTGLAVGLPIAAIPVGAARVVAYALGTAASGYVVYQMTTYQIMQQYLELKNTEQIAETGKGLTQAEENQLKNEFNSLAIQYGLWEAVPEAISNLLFVGILTAPLTSMIGKNLASQIISKIVLMYGQELLTETITQKGQAGVELAAGLREGTISWIEALKEIAPQTFLLTTIMAGAGQTIIMSSKAIQKATASLKNEIGAEHPMFEQLEQKIEEQLAEVVDAPSPTAPKVEVVPITEEVTPTEVTPVEVAPEVKPTPPTEVAFQEQLKAELAPEIRPEVVEPTVEVPVEVLDKEGSSIEGLRGQPVELNPDGTITLFHRTTPEIAERIRQTGKFQTPTPAEEVFFSNFREGQAKGFGDAIVEVRLKPEQVTLDDAFPSGEVHVSVIPSDIKIIPTPPAVEAVLSPQARAETRAREKGISIAEASREIAEEAIAEAEVAPPVTPVVDVTPPAKPPVLVTPLEERTQKELAIQKSKQDSFVETKETENLTKAGEDALNAQSESAGLPPPNIPPGMTGHIGAGGTNSENSLYDMVNRIIPGEDAGRAALRLWDGTRNRMATETIRWWRGGNKTLKDLGVGKTEGRNQRLTSEDSLALFKALHGEGAVPANLQSVFDELKTFLDQEASDMLAFDPTFSRVLMAHPDYFPRGWRPPKEPMRPKLGARPGFLKPRVDATFTEMIDMGWEPISWNPYDMAALRRMAGTEYREGQILISRLKTFSQAIAEHDAPREGWRVPKVGPAFEGKPYVGADGRAYMTPKIAVPTRVADILESIYGVRLEMRVGGVDIWSFIRVAGAVTKRAKLFASLFQHVDFLTRGWISAFTPAGIRNAMPLKFPSLAARITWSTVSPTSRANLETRILSGEPLYTDSDISLKMVADGGWKLGQDELLIKRSISEDLDAIVKDAQAEGLKVRWFQKVGQAIVTATDPVTRRLDTMARFWETGLFEGVYRESQAISLEYVIIPTLRRSHPEWTTEQIAGSAAEEVNKNFSTLAVWQSVLQQPAMREFARAMFFSWNESEALVRQATSAVAGKNKVYWQQYLIATYISLAIAANVINMIAEGEPLPPDRYVPFVLGSPYSSMPWGVAYNDKFLSPRLPWNGRNGQPIYLDIVGQMDTWLRWLLNPFGAFTSRVNVLPRAIINQVQGEDFWGRELKDWQDRVKQLVLDLFAPIGAGNLLEIARLQWPEVRGVIPEAEGRIGFVGSIIQSTGLNVRSIKTRDMLDKFARESGLKKADGTPVETWSDLEPSQRRELEKNETLQREMGLRSDIAVERQYSGAEGFAKLDELDQERIVRGEALVAELIGDLLEVDRATAFDLARAFRNEVSRLKKEIADRKSQVDEDFQLFKDTGELPDDPNKRALVEYYNIFDKALRPSGVMDWDKVRELELALRTSWTPAQEAFVDRNIGLTEWGPLMQEFIDAQKILSESGYWDEPLIDRRVFRFEHPEIEDILTGKFYNQKPIEEEAEKIGLKWQDVYRQIDAMKDKYKVMSDAELNKLPPPEGISAEDWGKMNPDKKQDALIDFGKETIYNENPGFWDDDKRKTAWGAISDLDLGEDKSLVFVSEYVEYSNIVREFGANSSQAKLYRFNSKELNTLGTGDDVFGWEDLRESDLPIWRIDVEWAEWDEWYDAIEDTVVDGQEFTAKQIRDAGLKLYPDYALARTKRNAYREGVPEKFIDTWVEYYSLPLGKARTDFLREHPEYYQVVWLSILENKPI